jgi:hypothetical protein
MNTIEFIYRRFSRERFRLPSDAQVLALEKQLNAVLPGEYREFLLAYNGGYFTEPEIEPVGAECPQDALTFLNGIAATHAEAELGGKCTAGLFDDNNPLKILPIGGTAMGGLIILDVAPGDTQGSIYLKKAFGDFYYLAYGIEEFFSLLREPTTVA